MDYTFPRPRSQFHFIMTSSTAFQAPLLLASVPSSTTVAQPATLYQRSVRITPIALEHPLLPSHIQEQLKTPHRNPSIDEARLPGPYESEPIPEAARSQIANLLESGDLFRYTASSNSTVSLLESEFSSLLGVKYALAVSSCSAALFISLKALQLHHAARVIIPAFTFAAVPSAVVHADCIPVLCEVGEDYRLDLHHFKMLLKEQDIAAVMVSHMRGHTSDMNAITALCEQYSIPLIEDAAHSLGAKWNGKNIGTIEI